MKPLRMLGFAPVVLCAAFVSAQSPWTPVNNVPNIGAGAVALLTDGRVLVHDESGNNGTWENWWTLTPDINGNYATGTWTQVASMPVQLRPSVFRFGSVARWPRISSKAENTTMVAVSGPNWEPSTIQWPTLGRRSTLPPGGATSAIASTTVLSQRNLHAGLLLRQSAHQLPLLNASNLTWTATGSGKFDVYDEEGLTLLPGGKVLDVDAYVHNVSSQRHELRTYNPNTGTWTSQGNTPGATVGFGGQCGGRASSYEVGPAVLRPDGTVFATGANSCGAGHTAIYNVEQYTWTAGPDFPSNLDIADGPAALLNPTATC